VFEEGGYDLEAATSLDHLAALLERSGVEDEASAARETAGALRERHGVGVPTA
jgi:hypothetical protein